MLKTKNENLSFSGGELPSFKKLKSILNLKFNSVTVTPKMIKKNYNNVMSVLHSSEASAVDGIPVMLLKSYEVELLYMLGKSFNLCVKESSEPSL